MGQQTHPYFDVIPQPLAFEIAHHAQKPVFRVPDTRNKILVPGGVEWHSLAFAWFDLYRPGVLELWIAGCTGLATDRKENDTEREVVEEKKDGAKILIGEAKKANRQRLDREKKQVNFWEAARAIALLEDRKRLKTWQSARHSRKAVIDLESIFHKLGTDQEAENSFIIGLPDPDVEEVLFPLIAKC
eukprot:Lankesteria_metandrocarpae@DN8211_c0_g1_i1.p1